MMAKFPQIQTVGMSGILVQFAQEMSEPANRAALAFCAVVREQDWPEVIEVTTSLVGTFVCLDLSQVPVPEMTARLRDVLSTQDWFAAALPKGRTLWHVPTLYEGPRAPQLEEAAQVAGVSADQAIKELSGARVRVLTIGFAPGQPYMGELPAHWNIPRQQSLTSEVPSGALVLAIRQLIVFTHPAPTGWRHIGQTAFKNFRPDGLPPIALSPGDELCFPQISEAALDKIIATDTTGDGGADREVLT